jgi:uncharacterized hydrophobic protein (TIGR00271 family)
MAGLREHLHGGPVNDEEIVRVREAILFEEPERQRRLTRFFILLILAAAIATFGLLADSVATVIGAMIVAPLMLPIMGVAFGVGLGDRKIILSSLTTSILGILAAIAIGFLLTWPIRSLIFVEANTQIMVRTAPRLIDLLAALATGLAGAFAVGRRDVSDTLPGVAIAISLVPPLANVGILLAAERPDLAMGSLLLFVTNYLAILLTGALMFTVMGFPGAYRERSSRRSKRTAVAIAVVLLVLIIVPLAGASYSTIRSSVREELAAGAAEAWLAGRDYRVVSITAGSDEVRMVITGEGVLPAQERLRDALRGRLAGVPIILEVVPQTRIRLETGPAGSQ